MAKSSEESVMQVEAMPACRYHANVEHSPFEHGVLHVKGKQSALHLTDMLSAVSTMDTMPTTSDLASSSNLDALDSDLEDSLHRDLTETDLYSSLDFDLGMEKGQHCVMSDADSVSICSDVHGDSLLGDPLLSELPIEYIGKNKSTFPHAKRMWQKGALIPWQRSKRMLRVEDSTSPFKAQSVDTASLINLDALDSDLEDSLHRDLTQTDLYSSLDFDLGMDEGRYCDISYDTSVYDCDVHGDPLLGDPLLSELPSEYIGKNKSPFPHAKQMCQKQGQDVGRQQGASILGRRRSLRVEDSTSQAELKWNLFGKAEVEETLKAQKVGRNLYTPLHEIWKDLPLSHSFDEDDVGLCAPDSDLKLDVFGKAEDEESLKVQNVDTVGGDPYASLQRHVAVMESFEKSLTKKDLPVLQSCDSEGLKIHVLAGPPVLALRRKRPWA